MTRPLTLLVAATAAAVLSACGAPTFRHGPDDGAGSREGFSAHHEAEPDGGAGGDAEPEEIMVDDETVDFDSEEGPYEEVE